MKIAVVAYEMEGRKTGVGRYLEGLLRGLSGLDAENRYELFFKGEPFPHPLWDDDRFLPHFDRRPGARPILWEQLRLPRLLADVAPDLVFSPAYSLPRGVRGPSMITVHDLSFEVLGGEFAWKERWRRRILARRGARRATRVLADTSTIARQLAETYDLAPSKVGVVPLGVDAKFREPGDPEADARLLAGLGVGGPYLLYLGSILDRRRVDLVIAAFAAAAAEHPDLRLVLAGMNRLRRPPELEGWIRDAGVGSRIVRVEYVAEEALTALYRGATLSFYLSAYEGYGLPPLESLAAGTPAIVGSGLALDDLWPEYPYRCPRLDVDAAVDATRRALADADERRRIGEEGRRRMAELDWTRAAETFLGEARKALG